MTGGSNKPRKEKHWAYRFRDTLTRHIAQNDARLAQNDFESDTQREILETETRWCENTIRFWEKMVIKPAIEQEQFYDKVFRSMEKLVGKYKEMADKDFETIKRSRRFVLILAALCIVSNMLLSFVYEGRIKDLEEKLAAAEKTASVEKTTDVQKSESTEKIEEAK